MRSVARLYSAAGRRWRSTAICIVRRLDDLIRVILDGIPLPASSDLGYMPGFKASMNTEQVAELVSYLRQQFAPDKPPWKDLLVAVHKARRTSSD